MSANTLSLPRRLKDGIRISKTLEPSVLASLQCPICCNYINPPIVMCENGHNVCSGCRKKLFRCPTCQQQFLEVRNKALEDIAVAIQYPCRYKELGCKEILPLDQIGRHHALCSKRMYECLFQTTQECKWVGRREEIRSHVMKLHEKDVLDFSDSPGCYVSWDVPNPKLYKESYQVVLCFNEVFVYRKTFDVARKKLYIVISYVGSEQDTTNFKYKLKLDKSDSYQKASFCSVPHQETMAFEEICTSGNCIVVDFDLLLYYVKGQRTMKLYNVNHMTTEL